MPKFGLGIFCNNETVSIVVICGLSSHGAH
nr:MAG TPA: hypothetical protein [Caudoviricetes sp.]